MKTIIFILSIIIVILTVQNIRTNIRLYNLERDIDYIADEIY